MERLVGAARAAAHLRLTTLDDLEAGHLTEEAQRRIDDPLHVPEVACVLVPDDRRVGVTGSQRVQLLDLGEVEDARERTPRRSAVPSSWPYSFIAAPHPALFDDDAIFSWERDDHPPGEPLRLVPPALV